MTRTQIKALWIASFKAFDKLHLNIAKAQFADAQRNGAQFSDFADLLDRLRAKAVEANQAAVVASNDPRLIAEAHIEWRGAK
jgi:hypothetical protein